MKALILLSIVCLSACSATSHIKEDKLYITRRYIGSFVSCTKLDNHRLMIETTKVDDYGMVFIRGSEHKFNAGQRLYIKRVRVRYPIQDQYWAYFVESDTKRHTLLNSRYGYKILRK